MLVASGHGPVGYLSSSTRIRYRQPYMGRPYRCGWARPIHRVGIRLEAYIYIYISWPASLGLAVTASHHVSTCDFHSRRRPAPQASKIRVVCEGPRHRVYSSTALPINFGCVGPGATLRRTSIQNLKDLFLKKKKKKSKNATTDILKNYM